MEQNAEYNPLEALGYSEFFSAARTAVDVEPARVVAEHKQLYVVQTATTELSARVTGKMLFAAGSRIGFPVVGDWVLVRVSDERRAVIYDILPRRTLLGRKAVAGPELQCIAANVDGALIVQAPDRDYSLNRFERYIALAEAARITPAVVLNKIDLLSPESAAERMSEIRSRFGRIPVYATSSILPEGTLPLRQGLQCGLTYCFLGSSGVGKSSLLNALLGRQAMKTARISRSTQRGRHLTTHRELFVLETGGVLIDNPGMREIGVTDAAAGIARGFPEIVALAARCRFSDCRHVNEPACAVLEAVRSGKLDQRNYKNYIKLVKEDEFNTMTEFEKREKDRKFGRFLQTVKKQKRRYFRSDAC